LLRLLAGHPEAELTVITSRSEAGKPVAELFPNLRGSVDLAFSLPDSDALSACDLVFFATPNGTAMTMVPELLAAGVRVVDLAADFRLQQAEQWQQWYGMEHACPDFLEEAVYGMPEVNRAAVAQARLIANPGCEAGLVDTDQLIADAKSGVSGAGRKAATGTLLCEASENFKAYAVPGHRHLPEIRQGLARATGKPVGLTFVPHLTPMIRGIHATLYARLLDSGRDLQALFEARYSDEPFVDVLPAGAHPETRSVRGANHCRIAIHRPQQGDTVVVLSVIDNLVKGAAGQALHNMNIMFGLPEEAGLTNVALLP
jgi:N-acetyl-gamma-glutamyl-phosphate reductase